MIFWATTEAGKTNPYDAAEMRAAPGVYVYGLDQASGRMKRNETTGHQSHYATCPDARKWTKKKPASEPPRDMASTKIDEVFPEQKP